MFESFTGPIVSIAATIFPDRRLGEAVKKRYQDKEAKPYVKMIGILFARPTMEPTAEHILPNFDYFDHRSGQNFDFFCAGYQKTETSTKPGKVLATVANQNISFDISLFVEIVKEIEGQCDWKYGGGTELLLTNVILDPVSDPVIDFSQCIVCRLDEMLADKAITSVSHFFEEIMAYAERNDGRDPTWGFSDQRAVKSVRSALTWLVLSLLPRKLGDEIMATKYFAISDLAK